MARKARVLSIVAFLSAAAIITAVTATQGVRPASEGGVPAQLGAVEFVVPPGWGKPKRVTHRDVWAEHGALEFNLANGARAYVFVTHDQGYMTPLSVLLGRDLEPTLQAGEFIGGRTRVDGASAKESRELSFYPKVFEHGLVAVMVHVESKSEHSSAMGLEKAIAGLLRSSKITDPKKHVKTYVGKLIQFEYPAEWPMVKEAQGHGDYIEMQPGAKFVHQKAAVYVVAGKDAMPFNTPGEGPLKDAEFVVQAYTRDIAGVAVVVNVLGHRELVSTRYMQSRIAHLVRSIQAAYKVNP